MGVINKTELVKPVTTLRDETINLLKNRSQVAGLTIESISKDTGLSVGWLQVFQREVSYSPGVVQVETLNAFLKSKGVTV